MSDRPTTLGDLFDWGNGSRQRLHSFIVDGAKITYQLQPHAKETIEHIDAKLIETYRQDSRVPMRGFLQGLLGIENLTIEQAPPPTNLSFHEFRVLMAEHFDLLKDDPIIAEFMSFLSECNSEADAKEWLMKNLYRFQPDMRDGILLAFFDQAKANLQKPSPPPSAPVVTRTRDASPVEA